MKISQTFLGNYLKAANIPQPTVLQIAKVQLVKMAEGDEKPVVIFTTGQQLVLNKTNASILVELWGDETAAWHGQLAELFSTTTTYGGRMVPCIRVRAPQQLPTAPPAPVAPQPIVPQPAAHAAPQAPTPSAPQQAVPQPPQAAPVADYPVDA